MGEEEDWGEGGRRVGRGREGGVQQTGDPSDIMLAILSGYSTQGTNALHRCFPSQSRSSDQFRGGL